MLTLSLFSDFCQSSGDRSSLGQEGGRHRRKQKIAPEGKIAQKRVSDSSAYYGYTPTSCVTLRKSASFPGLLYMGPSCPSAPVSRIRTRSLQDTWTGRRGSSRGSQAQSRSKMLRVSREEAKASLPEDSVPGPPHRLHGRSSQIRQAHLILRTHQQRPQKL